MTLLYVFQTNNLFVYLKVIKRQMKMVYLSPVIVELILEYTYIQSGSNHLQKLAVPLAWLKQIPEPPCSARGDTLSALPSGYSGVIQLNSSQIHPRYTEDTVKQQSDTS